MNRGKLLMNPMVISGFFLLSLALNTQGSAQSIHRTACNGEIEKLDSMLLYTDLEVQDNRGRSLLHWAVGCNQIEVFTHLLQQGINPNSEDRDGYTPLYVAVQFSRKTLFDTLVSLQSDDDWKLLYGASLLERAILNQNLSFVQGLVRAGVPIDVLNNRGSTPLEMSLRTGTESISNWLIAEGADESKVRKFVLRGEYMGQSPPGLTKSMFAPNFISTEEYEFGSIFNADGTEFYYGVDINRKPVIRYSKLVDGVWTAPKTILSHDKYGYNDPFLSPDEKRLYFISKRALDGVGDLKDHDIWYVERESDGWSEPINAGPSINTEGNEYYISFTSTGTMYFSSSVKALKENEQSNQDIYYAPFANGEFQKAISVGDAINTENYEADVFVAPDESYLIFCSTRDDGFGMGDMYISYKSSDGSWTQAVNMGESVNTRHHELCPFVTPDGKYLMYTSNQDIYWIRTDIIEKLRK